MTAYAEAELKRSCLHDHFVHTSDTSSPFKVKISDRLTPKDSCMMRTPPQPLPKQSPLKAATPSLTPNIPPITRVLNLVTQHDESYRKQDMLVLDLTQRLAAVEEKQKHEQELLGSLRVGKII